MNILIIGKNSYIGNHIDKWLTDNGHQVKQLDAVSEDWKQYDYSIFDTIVHVAGIVHRPNCKDWNLYKSVNTEMPVSIATKAKSQGVKQYIFISTMGVYAACKRLNGFIIDKETPLSTDDSCYYSRSKILAEKGLNEIRENTFNVAIVRPPSVYGKGCKGGYITGFKSIASKLPIIPKAYEKGIQSFIYIDNLCECIRLIIEKRMSGIFCPQDDEIPNANRLLEVICNGIGKKYRSSSFLGSCLKLISFLPIVKKAYGGISYSRELSQISEFNYIVVPFREGMKLTVTK